MSRTILIRRVKLRNILSHEVSEIEFQTGLTAIVGPNGAGKSTIVDAIVYALFARGTRTVIRGKSKRDIIRRGATEGEIEVDIDIGGQTYRVRRVISTLRAEDAQLYQLDRDGRKVKLVATGVDNVVEHILRLFGVPSPETIRYTIISRQDELTKLLDLRPAERKDLILKLLGLHDLEKAREVLRPYLRKYLQEAAKLEVIRTEIDRRKRRLDAIDRELNRIEQELRELEERKKNLEAELERLKLLHKLLFEYANIRELEKKARELTEIENELRKLEEAIKYAAGIRSIDPSSLLTQLQELNQIKRALEKLNEKRTQILEDIRRVVERVSKLCTIAKLDENVEDVEKIVEMLRSELENLRAKKHRIEAETRMALEASKIIQESASCPVCGRPLDTELKRKLEKELEMKIVNGGNELRNINRIEQELEKALNELKTLERLRIDVDSKIELYRQQIEQLASQLRPRIAEANRLCEQVSKISIFAQCFDDERGCLAGLKCVHQQLESVEGRIAVLQERRRALYSELMYKNVDEVLKEAELLRSRLRALGVDPESVTYSMIEEKIHHVNASLIDVERTVSSLAQKRVDLLQQKSEIEKELKELEIEYKDLEKSSRIAKALEYLTETVLGRDGILAKQLTSLARELIERYANMVLKGMGLDLRISISTDFDISVWSPLGEIDIRNVSGGEKTAIATALRMALAYAILGRMPGFFILDEPTAHLDAERRRTLFDLIKRISEKLPQVIVVTHDIEVIDIADNVLEVYKEGARSIVRYVHKQQ